MSKINNLLAEEGAAENNEMSEELRWCHGEPPQPRTV